MKTSRNQLRQKRHQRVRKKVHGSVSRPRLNVFRSNRALYAQVIDDQSGHTLVGVASSEKGLAQRLSKKKPVDQAFEVGRELAARVLKLKIAEVVFDRGGYMYHGRVKALADGAREGGLKF